MYPWIMIDAVSRSSAESEYRSVAFAVASTYWLRYLLRDLGVFLTSPLIVFCDNEVRYIWLLILSFMLVPSISKWIFILFVSILREGILFLSYTPTQDQLADLFTKNLSSACFADLRSNLCLSTHPPSINSSCKGSF